MIDDPTDAQVDLAVAIGVDIAGMSRAAVAAKLRAAVASALSLDERPATEKQLALAQALGIAVEGQSISVAREIIDAELTIRNLKALERLGLHRGDHIKVKGSAKTKIVSTVGRNNKVYLKGAGGESVWPTQVVSIIKRAT